MRLAYGRQTASNPDWKTKSFSDHLNPLRRFLYSNVNRPWDKVYSEICSQIDARSVAGRHLLQHLGDFVVLHCWFDAGRMWTRHRFGTVHEVKGLYVHPRTGLLRDASRRS